MRMTEHTCPDDIVLIYDHKGYVAGVQAVIEKIRLIDGIVDYANDPIYQEGTFFGRDVIKSNNNAIKHSKLIGDFPLRSTSLLSTLWTHLRYVPLALLEGQVEASQSINA